MKVIELFTQHLEYDSAIYLGVFMHQNITEADHANPTKRQRLVDNPVFAQQTWQITALLNTTELPVCDKVAGDIKRRFYGKLQKTFSAAVALGITQKGLEIIVLIVPQDLQVFGQPLDSTTNDVSVDH